MTAPGRKNAPRPWPVRRRAVAIGLVSFVALARAATQPAAAQALIAENDRRITARRLTLPGASGPLSAYLVRPANPRARPGSILLVHESSGLNDYVMDVARRLGVAGFEVLAPDFLSPVGGTTDDADEARTRWDRLATDQAVADAVACLPFMKGREGVSGKIAAVGFAWGGGIVARLAGVAPSLSGAVMFYGRPPPPRDAAMVKVPVLLHGAELDQRNLEGVAAFADGLKATNTPFQSFLYPGVGASFHNDGASSKFDAASAQLAWDRTLTFLQERLG